MTSGRSFVELLFELGPVIQGACALLLCLGVGFLLFALYQSSRALRASGSLATTWRDVPAPNIAERAAGLPLETIDQLHMRGSSLTGPPKEWWRVISDSLVEYTSPEGRKGWFLSEPAGRLLPEEDVVGRFYYASLHHAVPGLLTGLGLCATFVAILLALLGVSYDLQDKVEPIKGIDGLINGLSGKFLSSIVALVAAVVFTLSEKFLCERRLSNAYEGLVQRTLSPHPGA